MNPLVHTTNVSGFPCWRGKVRDIYEINARELLIVSTDRISAFDRILSTPIPNKGAILNQLSIFWFDKLGFKNHLVSEFMCDFPAPFQKKEFEKRTMLVSKTKVIPVEWVVRGFLTGNAYTEYVKTGRMWEFDLPPNLPLNSPFPRAYLTPTSKKSTGDMPITNEHAASLTRNIKEIKSAAFECYYEAREYAWSKGLILADTKFEFGCVNDEYGDDVLFIDEFLTPDNSRYWPVEKFKTGSDIDSLDKQFIRNYISEFGKKRFFENQSKLPQSVVEKTAAKYEELYYKLTGKRI